MSNEEHYEDDNDKCNKSLLYRFADAGGRNYPALHKAILYGRSSMQELRGMVEYDVKFQSSAACRTVMVSSMDDVCTDDNDHEQHESQQMYHGETALHMLIYKALYATKPCMSYIQNSTCLLKELAQACPRALSVTDDKGDSPFMLILSCPRLHSGESDTVNLSSCIGSGNYDKGNDDDRTMHTSSFYREKQILDAMKVCFEINPSLVRHKCVWRNNILHYALLSGRSVDFIRYILTLIPPEESVLGRNRRGEYPLHICAKTGEYKTTEVMMLLLYAAPEVAAIQDEQGLTPIHWAWIRHACGRPLKAGDFVPDNIYEILQEADASILASDDMMCFSSLTATLEILLQAAYFHCARQFRPLSWRMVHAAAAVCCPRAVLKLAIKLYPEQLCEQDENGSTALSLATSLPESKRWIFRGGLFGQPLPNVPEIVEEHPVSILVREYPDACQKADASGRLPLHLAIEKFHCRRSQKKKWAQIVSDLLYAYPGSICVRDHRTGLYPFMLAAVDVKGCMISKTAEYPKDESSKSSYCANSESNECDDADASQEASVLSWISGRDLEMNLFSCGKEGSNVSLDDWIDEVLEGESPASTVAAGCSDRGKSISTESMQTRSLSTMDDDV
eukprot:CAMPEP_0196827684 /NCGR_PEP_ID=MMETSP1362-20130617/94285_1 /TAXON_ID=163516 /ORGANISM="Leptocylindrus danicus, Strain CCMP1856" /LENGTH=619 /DNA_ID=CAMNT_0042208329 /DNA_START=357 /DNA_END=2213 /DNA_ORIENTATION=+